MTAPQDIRGLTEREQQAINAIKAFAIYAHDKLPVRVVEDLRIVADLAEEARANRFTMGDENG